MTHDTPIEPLTSDGRLPPWAAPCWKVMATAVFYGWWVVLACFVISFYVASVVFYGFTAFFDPLIKEFGWSSTQISLAASLRGLEMGVFAPMIGFLVDRFGPRKLILFGAFTAGLGLMCLAHTKTLFMFYSAFLLLGIGAGGCTSVVTMTAVANWFDKDAGKALGIMASGFGASGLMVPVIVWLIDAFHWRTALMVMGAGMWALGLPLAWIIRDRPEKYGYLPDGKSCPDPAADSREVGKPGRITFRLAFKEPSFIYLNVAEAIRMMVLAAVVTHIMPYLSHSGISRTTAGFVAAAIPLFSIAGRFGIGWLGDFFDKRHAMAFSFGLMAAGAFLFSLVRTTWLIPPFLLFFSVGYGGLTVLRGSILREYYGRDFFGKMIGLLMGVASFGGILGPTLAGWAFDRLESYRPVWILFSVLLCVSVLFILRMRPNGRTV